MRRISMLWFWVTPATCVSGIFLFAFGVSALSYFITGQENVDIWTVLKVMDSLPDPSEFIRGSMKIFNRFLDLGNKIKYMDVSTVKANGLQALVAVVNFLVMILRAIITIFGFVAALVVSFVSFPIYCVFFTFRCCSGMLALIGIDIPYNFTEMSWDALPFM